MKYGRNKIKDIFRDGISCLYLDEEQDDFCNFVEKLQQENAQLKEQISKAIERLNSKQIRFINEKDYILTDDDLDEIMQIFKIRLGGIKNGNN